METLRRNILTQIESVDQKTGRKLIQTNRYVKPKIYSVRYAIRWPSGEVCHDGDLLKSLSSVFERVLTFTGDTRIVQALPCEDYINQTWPSTGPRLIDSIMRALNRRREASIDHELSSTEDEFVEVKFEHSQLRVYAEGNAFDLAEIGTQLAWLGSALHSKTGLTRGFISNPTVNCVGLGKSTSSNGKRIDALSCRFNLGITALSNDEELGESGNCWQKMISNFVIVQWFPILSRPSASNGLEIPLNVAAGLIDAQKVTYFKGRPVIKGFSTMLCPIKREGGIIYWHVLGREDGRISFSDPRVDALSSIKLGELTFSDLESSRHIVGWCSEVRNCAGTADADLDIRRTILKPPSNEWSLKEFQVGGGMYITAQATFAFRQSQKPIEIKRGKSDYIGNMEWIARRHVILHDTEASERRAWLVDGASALLHLVLASLWKNQHGVMRDSYAFNLQELAPFNDKQAGMAASLSTLTSVDFLNKSLRLKDPTKPCDWYLMKDRIVEIFDLLAQMIDHQEDMNSRRGLGTLVSTSPWKQHVGWDFADVASYKEPCNLKVIHLRDHGKGWVHFAREVHAITLFGCGFGNIMHPSNVTPDPCARCFWESSAPKGGDILAVTLADCHGTL